MKTNLFKLTGIIKNVIIQEGSVRRFNGFDELSKPELNNIRGGGGDDDDDEPPLDWE